MDLACPIQILVDGQTTGKVNFAPATAASPNPAPLVHTVMQTTVLQKGGHTVAIQYAGAKNVVFTLKSWNLAVQAYPERRKQLPTDTNEQTPKQAGEDGLDRADRPDRAAARSGRSREALVPAELETPGARQGLAEDQAGPVVESFERLGVELVDRSARARAGWRWLRPALLRGSLAKNAVQPAARDELCVGGWAAHRISFPGLLTI